MSKTMPETATNDGSALASSLVGNPLRSRYHRMIKPQANRGILLTNYAANKGEIVVELIRTDPAAKHYFMRIGNFAANFNLAANIPDPLNPPNGHIEIPNDNNDTFRLANVQVNGIPPVAPRANNYRIAIGAYANGGGLLESVTFGFIAIPGATPVSVTVPAKGCLFFAYTPFGVALPKNEKLLESLPCFVPAPIDASTVGIVVPAGQTWNNEHGACDANGAPAGDNDTTIDAYFTSALGSENMKRLNKAPQPVGVFLDGLLTAMWDYGPENASDVNACAQMPIGTAGANLIVTKIGPTDDRIMPNNLLFGLHTDDDWSTQSGSLNVQLTWN